MPSPMNNTHKYSIRVGVTLRIAVYRQISSSWRQAAWDSRSDLIFQPNTYGYSPYVTSSLTRRWVYRSQLQLVLASGVVLRSESLGTQGYILFSQIRNSPNLEVQVLVVISPRNRVVRLYPQALGSLSFVSYNSQGYGGSIRPNIHRQF
jgi:hypothetical protein